MKHNFSTLKDSLRKFDSKFMQHLFVAGLLFFSITSSHAQLIGNPGFEDPILGAGVVTPGNWSFWYGLRSNDAPVFAGTYSGKVPGGSTGASMTQVLNATLAINTTYIFSANFRASAGTVTLSLKNFMDANSVGRDALLMSTTSNTWVSTGSLAFKTGSVSPNNTSPTITIFAPAGTTGYADDFSIIPYPVGDIQAPTAPTDLSTSELYDTSVNLTWTGSTDNNAVIGYEIYLNETLYATANPAMSTYSLNGLTPSTAYTITMKAVDGAGLKSDVSSSTSITTLAAITGSNLVINPGFETGAFTPWTSSTSGAISSTSPYEGAKCGSVGVSGASSTMTQTITGLQSNTKYILRAKYAAGNATFGVKNYLTATTGATSVALPVSTPVPATATWVSTPNIVFTTGAARTSADVYATTPSNIWARFDNFELLAFPVGSTTGLNKTVLKGKIYSSNSNIVVEGLASQTANVYSVSGAMIKSVLIKSNLETIDVNRGFYIVKVGGQNFKLLIQ